MYVIEHQTAPFYTGESRYTDLYQPNGCLWITFDVCDKSVLRADYPENCKFILCVLNVELRTLKRVLMMQIIGGILDICVYVEGSSSSTVVFASCL